jgi:hypothetical protein
MLPGSLPVQEAIFVEPVNAHYLSRCCVLHLVGSRQLAPGIYSFFADAADPRTQMLGIFQRGSCK